MALAPGTRIGTYEIVAALGAGGMGEVYRAHDVRLNREVAIKMLLSGVAADPEYLARFEREARTLAALNHQNIAQIYGVEEASGGLALIMELVEGPTLADVLARGPMPYEHVMYIALQLSAALEYAHDAGVIHRDLKPANIKLRPDFTVKVLDFGLAKKMPGQNSEEETAKLATSLTMAGTVFGTPGYMAPELLRGRFADVRSDIFAFGVVLFELLTGRNPFQRPSIFEIAEAILNPAPPTWPTTPLLIPDSLRYVVSRAMAKDVNDRYQTISEMRIDLSVCLGESDLAIHPATGSPPSGGLPAIPLSAKLAARLQSSSLATASAPPSALGQMPRSSGLASTTPSASVVLPPGGTRWVPVLLGALGMIVLLGIAGLGVWQFTRSTTPTVPPAEVKHTQVTFVGNVRGIAFSPDGRTAAYATTGADGRVMVRDIAGGQALEIWRGDIVIELQWLPDGSSVVVSGIQNNKLGLWVVPRLGGPARSLPARGAHVAVSPDGQHLALAMQNDPGFRVFPVAGGASRIVRMQGFRWLLGLDWGVRSNRVAVLTQADDGATTVWTIAPDGSEKRSLHTEKNLASIRWSPIDNVVYAIRARNEVAEVIRLPDRENAGEPEAILTGLPWDPADPYQRQGSLSTDGRRMLFVRGYAYANLWTMPIGTAPTPTPLTQGTSRYGRPRLSPDGKWIATSLGAATKSAIVKIPMSGGEPIPVTSGDAADTNPSWSPDGNQIAFLSVRSDMPRIWVVDPEVRSAAEVKDSLPETQGELGMDWLADGRLLWTVPGSQNYVIRDLQSGKEELLLSQPKAPIKSLGWLGDLRVSPNGNQIAVWWNRPGDTEDGMWLLEWPSRESRMLVPGDHYPAGWSADGQFIYGFEYLGRNVVKVSATTGKAQPIGAFPVGALEGCDVSPDAKIVICAVRETKSDAWLVENFDPKLPVTSGK
jgi:serine/threonine protein kinase/Tol biopolymer transport system component